MSKDYLTRRRVPKELQAVVGKRELRYALSTGILRQAKRKSKETSRKVKGLFQQLRQGKSMELNEGENVEIIGGYVQDILKEDE